MPTELQHVSHFHEAIMDFMIANPLASMGDVARQFGYSPSWLSTMVRSNAFQARLKEKHDEKFSVLAISLSEKLEAVAHDALENVHTAVLTQQGGPGFSLEVADTVLHRLGYAPQKSGGVPPPSAQVNATFVINQSDLAGAREVIINQPALENNAQASIESTVGQAGQQAGVDTQP